MSKDIDSIKKIDPKDLEKSREILLRYINEQDKNSKGLAVKEQYKKSIVKVDGVLSKEEKENINRKLERQKEIFRKKEQEKHREYTEMERKVKNEKMKELIKKQENDRKKIIEEEEKKIREEKNVLKQKREKAREVCQLEKIKLKTEIDRQKQLAIEQAEEEWKKNIEIKERLRIEVERKRETDRRKNKIKRAKKIKALKFEIKNWVTGISFLVVEFIRKKKKLIFKFIVLFAVSLAVLYLFFSLLLIVFKIDNGYTRGIASRIFVPAIISNIGLVEFYDYIDFTKKIKNEYPDYTVEDGDKKIVEELITNELVKKYRLVTITAAENQLKQVLNINFLIDKDYNQVGLARINDIEKKINSGETIEDVKKYADSFNYDSYLSGDDVSKKFGETVFNLKVGQFSKILVKDDGYYIVYKYDQRDDILGLKFVFVKGINFDDYIINQARTTKLFHLVK